MRYMTAIDLITALSRAPVDARVVLQLSNGDEVRITSAQNHCQIFELRADIPEPERLDNSAYIEEAMSQFPEEDFLETVITSVRALAFPPRMAEYKSALIDTLGDIQSEVARASEFGRDELGKALAEIAQ